MAGGFRSRFVPYVGGMAGSSGFVPQPGGRRALFGWWFGGFAGAGTPPPPPPPPVSAVPSAGHGRPPHGWVYITVEEYLGLSRKKLKKKLKEDIERAIELEPGPPTRTEARQIAQGLLAQVVAAPPPDTPPVDLRALETAIAALRTDLIAYAAKVADEREADDEEDDMIGWFLEGI